MSFLVKICEIVKFAFNIKLLDYLIEPNNCFYTLDT